MGVRPCYSASIWETGISKPPNNAYISQAIHIKKIIWAIRIGLNENNFKQARVA